MRARSAFGDQTLRQPQRLVQRDEGAMRLGRVGLGKVGAEMAAPALAPPIGAGGDQQRRLGAVAQVEIVRGQGVAMQRHQARQGCCEDRSSSRRTPTWRVMSARSRAAAAPLRLSRRSGVAAGGGAATGAGVSGSASGNVAGDAVAEHHRLQQRIGGEAIGAMQAGRGGFARRPQAGQGGAAPRVGPQCRPCGNARPARPGSAVAAGSIPAARQAAATLGNFSAKAAPTAFVGVEEGAAAGGDLGEDAARHNVARRELGVRVQRQHEALALRVDQRRAFAAQGFGRQRRGVAADRRWRWDGIARIRRRRCAPRRAPPWQAPRPLACGGLVVTA